MSHRHRRSLACDWPERWSRRWAARAKSELPAATAHRARLALGRYLSSLREAGIDPAGQQALGEALLVAHIRNLEREIPSAAGRYDQCRWLLQALSVIEPDMAFLKLAAELRALAKLRNGSGGPKRLRAYRNDKAVPIRDWPKTYLKLWEAALCPGGNLHGLSRRHLRDIAYGWGRYLHWLENVGAGEHEAEDDAKLRAYLQALESESMLSPRTRAKYLFGLWRALVAFEKTRALAVPEEDFCDPDAEHESLEFVEFEEETPTAHVPDFVDEGAEQDGPALETTAWLLSEAKRLDRMTVPVREKTSRMVELDELVWHGVRMMAEAEAMRKDRRAGILYRTGLMITLAATRCMRFSNLLELDVPAAGRPAVPTRGFLDLSAHPGYLYWPAGSVKNRIAKGVLLPTELRPFVDRFVEFWYPLLKTEETGDALWPNSENGRRLSDSQARVMIEREIQHRTGRKPNPHLFRDAAATWIAENHPEQIWAASRLLWHHDERSTERYRAKAKQVRALDELKKILDAIASETAARERMTVDHRGRARDRGFARNTSAPELACAR